MVPKWHEHPLISFPRGRSELALFPHSADEQTEARARGDPAPDCTEGRRPRSDASAGGLPCGSGLKLPGQAAAPAELPRLPLRRAGPQPA